jgi:hypothetical protein
LTSHLVLILKVRVVEGFEDTTVPLVEKIILVVFNGLANVLAFRFKLLHSRKLPKETLSYFLVGLDLLRELP